MLLVSFPPPFKPPNSLYSFRALSACGLELVFQSTRYSRSLPPPPTHTKTYATTPHLSFNRTAENSFSHIIVFLRYLNN